MSTLARMRREIAEFSGSPISKRLVELDYQEALLYCEVPSRFWAEDGCSIETDAQYEARHKREFARIHAERAAILDGHGVLA